MPLNPKIFTKILTDLCDVHGNAAVTDGYGHAAPADSVAFNTNVACRILPLLRKNQDLKTELKATISYYSLYIMPYIDPNGKKLNENHWLHINGDRYDIVEVLNPVIAGAPCELLLQRVKP